MAVSGREKTDMRQSVDIYSLYTIYIVYLLKNQREEKKQIFQEHLSVPLPLMLLNVSTVFVFFRSICI